MITELTAEASEFQDALEGAVTSAGGLDLVTRAEGGETVRPEIESLLGRLGVWDLQPSSSAVELEAAAVACRVAGRYALPYPIAERLAAADIDGVDALGLVGPTRPRLNLVDGDLDWLVVDLDGRTAPVVSTGEPVGGRLAPFVRQVKLGEWGSLADPAPVVVLQSWIILGMVEHAAEMTFAYVQERRQFGRTLAEFQGTQFRVADMSVWIQSLEGLAKYALWSVASGQSSSVVDALLLRVAALEAAENVFRSAHQLHGAIGFCDETHVSWLSRYSQPLRRLPFGRSQTEAIVLEKVSASSIPGLFDSDNPDALVGR